MSETLDYGQASYDIIFPGQSTPMTITGPEDVIAENHERAQSYVAPAQPPRVAKAAQVAIEATTTPARGILDGLRGMVGAAAMNLQAITYDKRNGTNFYGALQEKRQLERDLGMARRLGLLTVDPCQKHRHAIDTVKQIR